MDNPNDALQVCSIENTSDGGSIIGGKWEDINTAMPEFLLIKLDAAGNIQWSYRYGNPLLAPIKGACMKVIQNPDSTYIASVGIGNGLTASAYPSFLKFDQNGTFQWAKCYLYGNVDGYAFSAPVLTGDGKVAASFMRYDISTANFNALLIKADLNGLGVCNDSNYVVVPTAMTYNITAPLVEADFGVPAIYSYASQEIPYPMQSPCFTNVGISSDLRPPLSAFVFPNPATDFISLQLTTATVTSLFIANLLGQTLLEIPNYASGEQINVSTLPLGLYSIRLGDHSQAKFIIAR